MADKKSLVVCSAWKICDNPCPDKRPHEESEICKGQCESQYRGRCIPVEQAFKPRPTIVCLCGSTRFGEHFRTAQFQETLDGKIVLTIGCNMKSDDDLFSNVAEPLKIQIKKQLDELHLRKIDLADQVLILNVNSYIGESTKKELEYAIEHEKVIRFLEPVGAPGVRDPELPCDSFQPGGTAYGKTATGNCETDGHYLCGTCVNREPFKLSEEEGEKE